MEERLIVEAERLCFSRRIWICWKADPSANEERQAL